MMNYKELPYASSLCGACSEACPVKIPLHELLLKHRERIVEIEGKAPISEAMLMKAFSLGESSSSIYAAGAKIASRVISPIAKNNIISKGPGPLKAWTEFVISPAPKKERFRDWFKEHEKGSDNK